MRALLASGLPVPTDQENGAPPVSHIHTHGGPTGSTGNEAGGRKDATNARRLEAQVQLGSSALRNWKPSSQAPCPPTENGGTVVAVSCSGISSS